MSVRPVAGRLAEQRSRVLLRLREGLVTADSPQSVAAAITGVLCAELGAVSAGVAVLDPLAAGQLRYLSLEPLPEVSRNEWLEFAIDATTPAGAAVALATPSWLGSRRAAEAAFPGISELLQTAGVQAMVHLPLLADGHPFGVLAISWATECGFDPDERSLLSILAEYSAEKLHGAERHARALNPALLSPADDADAVTPSASTAAAARPIRILIVDDTVEIRQLLAALFTRRSDAEVVAEAGDGGKAIELAAALQPDLIVLDVAMPVLDGISALPELASAAPNARIVMFSALPAAQQAGAALAAGAAAYVEKNTVVATLAEELLEGAKLLDAAIRELAESVDQHLAATPDQVQRARHFVADALRRWEQTPLADTITLLLSELVTNAVVHAQAAPKVSVRLFADRVHVEVTDTDARPVTPQPFTADATSGRGLALVDALALRWGTAILPEGKVVWFDVAREPLKSASPHGAPA